MVWACWNFRIRPELLLFPAVWTIIPLSSNPRLNFQNIPLSVSMIVCVNMKKKKIRFAPLMVCCLAPILTAWGGLYASSRHGMFAWPRIGCAFEMIFLGYWSEFSDLSNMQRKSWWGEWRICCTHTHTQHQVFCLEDACTVAASLLCD